MKEETLEDLRKRLDEEAARHTDYCPFRLQWPRISEALRLTREFLIRCVDSQHKWGAHQEAIDLLARLDAGDNP